jgi:hypothetical protein
MKRAVPLIAGLVLLSACVAVTVEKHRPRRGPVKEVGYIDYGGGQIRYSAEGWGWILASRRKTAMKLMSANCGKDLVPAITDEYSRMDADAAYNGEDIEASMKQGDEHFKIERYIHLAYECRPKGAPAPVVSTTTVQGPVMVIPAVSSTTAAVVVSTEAAAVPVKSTSTLVIPEIPR